VALQKLPVIFCIDRAGLVGEDGATHHGLFDLAFLRSVPNIIISAPMNEIDLRNLMYTAYRHRELPFAIRYPRGRGVCADWRQPMCEVEIGKARVLHKGEKVALISIGNMGSQVQQAMEEISNAGLNPTHVDMRFLAPFDRTLLLEMAATHEVLFTVEDGVSHGGLFSAVAEVVAQSPHPVPVIPIAVPDRFVEHGDVPSLYKECGLTPEQIAQTVLHYNA
jgi:1-deoxy-D-xylulose-5-phosphate synthase